MNAICEESSITNEELVVNKKEWRVNYDQDTSITGLRIPYGRATTQKNILSTVANCHGELSEYWR